MNVSIVIVNYNTLKLTKACIDSVIEKTSGLEYEIILVDNASSDGSSDVFKNDERIIFIEASDNIGFGKANNLGVKHAKGDYLFFLNSDTLLLNNAVDELWKFCESHKENMLGAVGCILCDVNGKPCHSYAKLATAKDLILSYGIAPFCKSIAKKQMGIDAKDESADCFEVGYVTGADIFVHRDVLKTCGAFDPDFFMYSEEAEMQWRFKQQRFKNLIIKTPKIIHMEGMSQAKKKSPTIKKILMTQTSLFLYVKKTSNKVVYALFRSLFPFTRLPFLLLSKRSIKEKVAYVKFLLS